ncbi:MAG: hypothetical protein ACOCUS_02500 [Polyangiales bacterium]
MQQMKRTGRAYKVEEVRPGRWAIRHADGERWFIWDHRFDTAEEAEAGVDVLDQRLAAEGEPLDREGYEAACAELGVEPWSDADIDGKYRYAMQWGDFRWPHYDVEHIVRITLARRRWRHIEDSKPARPAEPERGTPPPRWGASGVRYDDECDMCHRRPVDVDNRTDLCRRCWGQP